MLTRRQALQAAGAGLLALVAPCPRAPAAGAKSGLGLEQYPWLNQKEGPRPAHVWENMEDLIYHDLEYGDPALDGAPEFCAFMRRVWVFNRAMRWRREGLGGAILCYAAGGDLALTGVQAVSTWHSDPDNQFEAIERATRFEKRSPRRCRDAAVLPALQFHLGQHPTLEVVVNEADADWQFAVSLKGRSGPPLFTSGWRRGADTWQVNLAHELKRRGYNTQFAELHFVMGVWTEDARRNATVVFDARLLAQPAVVGTLPVIRTTRAAAESGIPLGAVVIDAAGNLHGAATVRVRASVAQREVALEEQDRFWKAALRHLGPGDHAVTLFVEGEVKGTTTVAVRITDGQFDGYDPVRQSVTRGGRLLGPLTGSYQGTFFFKDAGRPGEGMVNGQREWDDWRRIRPPGEHQHYWEALTEAELEQRFAYLQRCGWDLLHLHQHWGVWARLDAGGRIAPHTAEQLALYLRVAARHGLKVIQALTSYEYSLYRTGKSFGGTVPYSRYFEAGFHDEEFFDPAPRPFDQLFHQYLADFAHLFRDETALFAMSASGEGDHYVGPRRGNDVRVAVGAQDANHLFVAEPIHLMNKLPRSYTADWGLLLCGARTYAIGQELLPEYDLGVEFKFYQLGRLYQAEGSYAAAPHYVRFRQAIDGPGPESWTGTARYRTRLRDSLYLGLVHRIPMLMTWDEQVAEDEHRILRQVREVVDWSQPWLVPRLSVRVNDGCVRGEGRRRLAELERWLTRVGLSAHYVPSSEPASAEVLAEIDARGPFVSPAFRAQGGLVPEALKAFIPLEVSEGYAVSGCWSADRRWLLAYVYNVTHHLDRQGTHDLSQRYHRAPEPARVRFRLQHFPPGGFQCQCFDLNLRQQIRQGSFTGSTQWNQRATDHDFFVLVRPR